MITAHKPVYFPGYRDALEKLVAAHQERSIEPLLLAIYFTLSAESEDVYLFEVVEQLGYEDVRPDEDLFEVEYAATSSFPLPENHYLHLFLTNPAECLHAIEKDWPKMKEIRQALRNGSVVLHKQGKEADEILNLLGIHD